MATFHVMAGASGEYARPEVRRIGVADLVDALKLGLEDFKEKPSHYVFLCLMYPIAGVFLVVWSSGADLLPLLYPLMSGFALIGPIAAIGLYEISRRREQGLDSSWHHALDVRHSPALPSIVAVGLMLFVLFVAWLIVAQHIYTMTFDEAGLTSISALLSDVLTTSRGFSLMLWGNLAGLVFAVIVLATTVVTFPLLLDRDIGAVAAVDTSIRATLTNPGPIALWGLIVAALLVVGTIPIFAGLAVVMPILGHSTWHLYRKLIAPAYPNRTP
ncbi:DUF2189 domain-containing protein [Rhizobium calliandrae]|uniref:DUF2189 domain-containing protein n=1 Tax=Rhizobium calliandrae TaxID=1312182 RepID=A0ABT7KI86_9HYPH|nr:DUF2189 domain-containing protein [Rhizobium calliandrae]MDL2407018.1 DUF2189 domain-containing protein [Rhizobium calliandrae]